MSNAIFPALIGLKWDIVKRPTYNTKIQRAVSGKEYRAAFMQTPVWNFTLGYDLLRDAAAYLELQTLCGFFLARQGSFDSWLYTDSNDWSVTAEAFGTGDGADTTFQLSRAYGAGGFTASDYVQNVNTLTGIYDNGTPVAQGAGAGKYTIDANGLVTFGTAPVAGHALTWTGTFYYRCRFMADALDFNNFMSGMWDLKQLQFLGSPQNKV